MTTKKVRLLFATITTISMVLACLAMPSEAAKKLRVSCKRKVAVNSTTKIKTNMKAKFKSSNKKIATINKKGVIKGKKVGKVKIKITAKKNKKLKVTVKINVVAKSNKAIQTASDNNKSVIATPIPKVSIQKPEESEAPTPIPEIPTQKPEESEAPTLMPEVPTQKPEESEEPEESEGLISAQYIGEEDQNYIYKVTYDADEFQMKLEKPKPSMLAPLIKEDSTATYLRNKEIDGKEYILYEVAKKRNDYTIYVQMQMELPSLAPTKEPLPEEIINAEYIGEEQTGGKKYIVYKVSHDELVTNLKIEVTDQIYNILFGL